MPTYWPVTVVAVHSNIHSCVATQTNVHPVHEPLNPVEVEGTTRERDGVSSEEESGGSSCTDVKGCDVKGLVRRCERLVARADLNKWCSIPNLVKDSIWSLACSSTGSRLLRKILFQCRTSVQVQVAEGMKGRVWEASISQEANYLLQACIEVLPSHHVQFIIDEMSGRVVLAAQDKHASHVLEKLLEHCSSNQTSNFVDELTRNAQSLCRHGNGSFVVKHILKYGTEEQQHTLAVRIAQEGVRSLAKHVIGNHVVTCALATRNEKAVKLLAAELMPALGELSRHNSGSFVARELKRIMKLNGEVFDKH